MESDCFSLFYYSSELESIPTDQLRHMEGTIILHMTFAVKQDQDLGKEFLKYMKVIMKRNNDGL